MNESLSRRRFLASSAVASLATAAAAQAAPTRRTMKKSLIGKPTRQLLESWKEAGFDGMEATDIRDITLAQCEQARKDAESLGMRIHSVLLGWMNFNSPDRAVVDADIAVVEKALAASQALGAEALLVVPCRVGDMEMPQPWDFEIEFDEKTGMVKRVAAGDNAAYKQYIQAQNQATRASRAAVKRLIPAAEKSGVVIALENVWNNLWVKPEIFAHFIRSFDSPWVQCYFDIGNNVKYARPEEWIRALGQTIVKAHVKDFIVDRNKPRGGEFVGIRDGDVDWPSVMAELDAVGYKGWMTIEGSRGLSIEEQSKRLDLIIAGK